MARVLLKHSADPEAKQQDGRTPLHEAGKWGQADIAQLLLQGGSSVSTESNRWETPYALAKRNSTGLKEGEAQRTLQIMEAWDAASTHTAILEEWKREEEEQAARQASPTNKGGWSGGGARIEMGHRLGGGGFKTVYKARWFGKEVAVAVVKHLTQAQKSEFEHETRQTYGLI